MTDDHDGDRNFAALAESRRSALIGRRIEHHYELPSTNDRAWQAAAEGAAEGTVIIADRQTQGRGRHGRAWTSIEGRCLACSVLLRPRIDARRFPLLTVAGALSVLEAAQYRPNAPLGIRWPNDVLKNGRKVAGVLLEAQSDRPEALVLGIGVNLRGTAGDLPDVLRDEAAFLFDDDRELASAASHEGAHVAGQRTEVLAALLDALERWYRIVLSGRDQAMTEAWRRAMLDLGRPVRVDIGDGEIEGRLSEVDALRGITLALADGSIAKLNASQVRRFRAISDAR